MTITYRIVQHDGGWAYQLGDSYSETFPSHAAALAARRADGAADDSCICSVCAVLCGGAAALLLGAPARASAPLRP